MDKTRFKRANLTVVDIIKLMRRSSLMMNHKNVGPS